MPGTMLKLGIKQWANYWKALNIYGANREENDLVDNATQQKYLTQFRQINQEILEEVMKWN